jgi:hypothetical protein
MMGVCIGSAKKACVACSPKEAVTPVPYFEQTVLPQVPGSVADEYRKAQPIPKGINGQTQHLATKLCLNCRKRQVRPQRYCAVCAKIRKRVANREHIRRKRRDNVGKSEDSPIPAEALTKTAETSRYSPHRFRAAL